MNEFPKTPKKVRAWKPEETVNILAAAEVPKLPPKKRKLKVDIKDHEEVKQPAEQKKPQLDIEKDIQKFVQTCKSTKETQTQILEKNNFGCQVEIST